MAGEAISEFGLGSEGFVGAGDVRVPLLTSNSDETDIRDHDGNWVITVARHPAGMFQSKVVVSGALTGYKDLDMELDEYQTLRLIAALAKSVMGE